MKKFKQLILKNNILQFYQFEKINLVSINFEKTLFIKIILLLCMGKYKF
jgi:hypothetical protein